jgi:hypothetical protein
MSIFYPFLRLPLELRYREHDAHTHEWDGRVAVGVGLEDIFQKIMGGPAASRSGDESL